MPKNSPSYKECRYPLVAALAKMVTHKFNDFHHKGQTIDCLNGDGSYIRIHVGDRHGCPLEDHMKKDGSWRYPPQHLYVIAVEFLPEYIEFKE